MICLISYFIVELAFTSRYLVKKISIYTKLKELYKFLWELRVEYKVEGNVSGVHNGTLRKTTNSEKKVRQASIKIKSSHKCRVNGITFHPALL